MDVQVIEPHRPRKQKAPLRKKKKKKVKSNPARTAALVGVAGLLMAGRLAAVLWTTSATIPRTMYGFWTTPDARYENRGFDLSAAGIAFQIGPGVRTPTLELTRVDRETQGDRVRYDITYQVRDGVQRFSFFHSSSQIITLANQPDIRWNKGQPLATQARQRGRPMVIDSSAMDMSPLKAGLAACIMMVADGDKRDTPVSCLEASDSAAALTRAPTDSTAAPAPGNNTTSR